MRIYYHALLGLLLLGACTPPAEPPPPQVAQFPSPMEEHTREHQRLASTARDTAFTIEGILPRPVAVFLPAQVTGPMPLLVHFHGVAFVPARAVEDGYAVAVVNLGSGSGVYEQAFSDPAVFGAFLDAFQAHLGPEAPLGRLYLSSFSAGYGAVRALLRQPAAVARIDGLVLLDGLHTDYEPARRVLAEGGTLNTEKLQPFLAFAREAVAGRKVLLVTHSAVFPGTYASTTETAAYLLDALGLRRTAVLRWGPVGMQQVGEAGAGRFKLLTFAGNTAPDHVDHLHALPTLLAWFQEPQ